MLNPPKSSQASGAVGPSPKSSGPQCYRTKAPSTHSEFLIHKPVLGVFVKLLLGIHVDVIGEQVGRDLKKTDMERTPC